MKNYFSHDEGARNDPKLIKVLMRLGQAGKGVYWDLVEMLYEQGGCLLISECESYAFALRTENELIQSLINDFGLFENDGQKFWSASLLRRLEVRQTKSAKAAESASKRWNNANAMRTHSEGNAIKGKDSKGKDSKEEEIKPSFEKEAKLDGSENLKNSDFQNPEPDFTPEPANPLTEKEKKASQTGREIFEAARQLYPGEKRGAEPEWRNFKKRYKPEEPDLPDVILAALQNQIAHRKALINSKTRFIPEWPHFMTWINQSRWTTELPKINGTTYHESERTYEQLQDEYRVA